MHAPWKSLRAGPALIVAKAPPIGRDLLEEIIARVLGLAADQTLRDRLVRVLLQTAVAGGTSTAESLGLVPTVSADGEVIRRLVQGHTPAIVGINETTRTAIREALYDVIAQGGALGDQVAAVRTIFSTATRARAVTIARTESGIFWHAGGRAQGEDAGARSHTWLATRDPRVRETHRAADGQCRPIDQPYQIGGSSLMHPLDPNGDISEIANCRCTETFGVSSCGAKSALTYEQGTAVWKRTMRSLAAHERLAAVTMRRIFREQRTALLSEIARVST